MRISRFTLATDSQPHCRYPGWLQGHKKRAEEGDEFSQWIIANEEALDADANITY